MIAEIKQAVSLFHDKVQFNLSDLKKNLNLSGDDHQRLTSFLLHANYIEKADPVEWGTEHWYKLSEDGFNVHSSIKTYPNIDTVLKFYVENPNSHLMKQTCEVLGIPFSKAFENILLNAKILKPDGTPVKEGQHLRITEGGINFYENGGFVADYDRHLETEFNEFEGTQSPIQQKSVSKTTHDSILMYLKEQNDANPGEWVDLLSYYKADKESYIRELAKELKRKEWITIKPIGSTGVAFYDLKTGSKTSQMSFPNPLKAKLTYDGIKKAESLIDF